MPPAIRSSSRSSRARRPTSSSRRTSIGGTTASRRPDQAGHSLQPARKSARADRAEGCERQRQYPAQLRSCSAAEGGRLSMANVDAVPGKYGKAALEKLGAWDSVKDKIAQ